MARKSNKKPPSRNMSGNKRKKSKKTNPDILCVIIIAVGIFVGISFFTEATGVLGTAVKSLFMGLLGFPAYFVCFLVLACTIHYLATKEVAKHTSKYLLATIFIINLSAIWHVTENVEGDLWKNGVNGKGGGIIGGSFGYLLSAVCGFWGSIIILFAIAIILLIAIFNISFSTVINSISEKFSKDDMYDEEDVEKVPEKMPPEMKREIKKIKKQIFDFEREFGDIPKKTDVRDPYNGELLSKPKKGKKEEPAVKPPLWEQTEIPPVFDNDDVFPPIQDEVQATAEPDKEAISRAIDVAAEASVLPKKKRQQEPEQIEIQMENEHIDYSFPPLDILKEGEKPSALAEEELERTAKKLIDTLKSFGVDARIIDYSKGPTITRYELQPSAGVKIAKITGLSDDLALNLAVTGIRIEPIAGKTAIGLEVPNKVKSSVAVREVLGTAEFANFKSKLAFALGKDIAGNPVVGDIAKMPHLLIAGSTGSGKSVCINTLITSILYKATPNEVKLVMVDPKVVELGVYNGIPHLLIPVVTDPRKAAGALQWAVNEMTNRYKLFADTNVRDLKGYNSWAEENEKETLPQIVIIIDELADLMMVAPHDVEDTICRLAQMARAAGMHLVIATQRPSVDVITGIIKANIPSRIAFAVSSFVDSKTILDSGGAEKLLGKGDMLYYPIGYSKPQRVQGAFVSDKEVEKIVAYIKGQNIAEYDQDVIEQIENAGEKPNADHEEQGKDADVLLPQAVEMAIEAGQASVAMYQRRLKVGYQRAARLIDQMESRKIIGPFDGTKPREVLITKAQWNEMMMNIDPPSDSDGDEFNGITDLEEPVFGD